MLCYLAFLVNIFILSSGLSGDKESSDKEKESNGWALSDSDEKDDFCFWHSYWGFLLLHFAYDPTILPEHNFLHDNVRYEMTFLDVFMIWLAARFICYETAHNLSVIRKIFTTSYY